MDESDDEVRIDIWKVEKKHEKVALFPCRGRNLFLVFPATLETWPKAFHSYPFIKRSRNDAFRHFLVNFIKRFPWKQWPLEKFRL